MKRTYMLLAWVLLCYCSISGIEVDEYLIGTYSQWRVDYENDPVPGFSNLRQKLFDAGFNAVNFTIKDEYYFSTAKLGAALSSLHNGGTGSVRTILSDFSWNSDPLYYKKIGAYSLYGNYLQMEAEANVEDKGFFGDGITSVGLVYKNVGTATIIRNLDFSNLGLGLNNLHDSAVRDSITSCTFVGNSTGIHFYGPKYSPFISDCTFSKNDIGAILEAASPELRDCLFDQCELGIRTERSTGSTGGIYDCTFQSGETAIVSRGSNLRVAGNLFYTENAILNHSGSILNMGKSAKNLFNAELVNLKFEDTISYNARVQLYQGHNDFYHHNPGPLIPTHDFHFDSNWYVSPQLGAGGRASHCS